MDRDHRNSNGGINSDGKTNLNNNFYNNFQNGRPPCSKNTNSEIGFKNVGNRGLGHGGYKDAQVKVTKPVMGKMNTMKQANKSPSNNEAMDTQVIFFW